MFISLSIHLTSLSPNFFYFQRDRRLDDRRDRRREENHVGPELRREVCTKFALKLVQTMEQELAPLGKTSSSASQQKYPKLANGTPSVADRKAIKIAKAKKGFSKYIHPKVELCIGVLVLIMTFSPAFFFIIALSVPYYTLEPSSCNQQSIKVQARNDANTGSSSVVLPVSLFFRTESGIMDVTEDTTFGNIFGRTWTMWLNEGVCPDGDSYNWQSGQPPTAVPTMQPTEAPVQFPPTFSPSSIPAQPAVNPSTCLDYSSETVWNNIDLQNQRMMDNGGASNFADMNQGAKDFKLAHNISVVGCIVAWLFVVYSIYDAVNMEDLQDGHAGLSFEDIDDDGRHSIAPFQMSNPENNEEDVNSEIALDLVREHFDSHGLGKLNMNIMARRHEEEEHSSSVTYTRSITIEFVCFLSLFAMAVSAIKLLEDSALSHVAGGWEGFFVTCTMKVTASTGPAVLFYQCISMGIYTFTLLVCELYYVAEYFAQCMHNIAKHPDDRMKEKLERERTGEGVEVEAWTGPVFLSRIHLTKSRTIKGIWQIIFGSSVPKLRHDSHLDGFAEHHSPPERTLTEIRADVQKKRSADGAKVKSQPVKQESAPFVL